MKASYRITITAVVQAENKKMVYILFYLIMFKNVYVGDCYSGACLDVHS